MADGFDNDEDRTILRPTPGIRRPTPGGEPSRPPRTEARSPAEARSSAPAILVGGDTAPEDFIAQGQNPLLAAAGTLLVLGARLKGSVTQADMATLRHQASEELSRFVGSARSAGVAPEIVDVASYVLCTFFDTSVMRTPWGARGEWGKHSLLVAFHREAVGGENFFRIAERALADPERNLDLLELLYSCIALGYEGKFGAEPAGKAALSEFQQRLYRAIRDLRGERPRELSIRWEGTDEATTVRRILPVWAVVVGAILVVFLAWTTYRQMLNQDAEPVLAALARPIVPEVVPSTDAVQPVRRIRPYLSSQENGGLISVEEEGVRTMIVLNATNLFASGSANLTDGHEKTIDAIAAAIDAVPGRVIVIGHTDDQPLRSFRFSDNFALSRARAQAVGDILRERIAGASQIEISGAGSTQPRFLPPELPANRPRNRRVELIHFAQGEPS